MTVTPDRIPRPMPISSAILPTPLVQLETLDPQLHAKVEYLHPSGSMKHRAIPRFIESLVTSGELDRRKTLAVRSAGSAALTTAWIGARLGIAVTCVLPPFASDHLVSAMRWLGATVHRVPPAEGSALMKAFEHDRDVVVLAQAREERLIDSYRPVAREILEQLPGVAAIVVGIGTGLSSMGIAREVRDHSTGCVVVGTEPAEAAVASGQPWAPHRIPGLAPPIAQPLLDTALLADIVPVPSRRAWNLARRVARDEGLMIGPSSGATLAAGLALRERGVVGPIVAICACRMAEYHEMAEISTSHTGEP